MLMILIACILTPLAQTSSILERKIYDPYIICHNPPPPLYDFPESCWNRGYRTTMDLCSAANGRRGGNMGCFCSSAHSDLHCDPERADPLLADATTCYWDGPNSEPESFTEYCSIACYCADVKSATIARTSHQRNSELNRIMNNPSFPSAEPSNAVDSPALLSKQCGANCSSNADCSSAGKGCTCQTQKEQYVPAKGAAMFVAACIISLGGKREEQRPCPCNVTYVSHACCGAADGIVQEPERFKLGEISLLDELR